MNIVFISPQIYPCFTGGLEIFNHYLIRELALRGHEIWLLTNCNERLDKKNIHYEKLNKIINLPTVHSINASIATKLLKIRNKCDMIHVPYTSNSYLIYPILFVHKLLDIPYVITIHGGGMYKWDFHYLHKLFFTYSSGIIAVSDTIRIEYERRCGKKINMIPPLIPFYKTKNKKNKLKEKYGFKSQDKILLSLGSVKKIKGSDILLDAFLKLDQEYIENNNLKLLYIGDGNLRYELEKKVIENNRSNHIKFLGTINREKIPDIYHLSDIYIIPSRFEGTPISLLEAKFNGLPIIGSNIKGISNLIKHQKSGLLFESGNSNDLKNKIRDLVENTALAEKLGKNAEKDISRNYRFEDMVTNHLYVYKQSLETYYG